MEDVQATNPATEVQKPASEDDVSSGSPGFSERGRMRRRARFLRKARELAYRDLGGLVYNLHRFGQRNDALVLAKLTTLGQIDAELRTLEGALAEHQSVTVRATPVSPPARAARRSTAARTASARTAGSRWTVAPSAPSPVRPRAPPHPRRPPHPRPPSHLRPPQFLPLRPHRRPRRRPPHRLLSRRPTIRGRQTGRFADARHDELPAAVTSAPGDYTTIDRPVPARSPQTPAPASPAAPTPDAPSAPAAEPTDQDQPTVIVRPPGAWRVSVATPPAVPAPTAAPPPADEACPLCGAPLAPEQEWCLRCGAAARTRLAASPAWKTP